MTLAEFPALLEALIAKQRSEGVECSQQGHTLAERLQANCFEVGPRRVISVSGFCLTCREPVTVSEEVPQAVLEDARLLERSEREILKTLKVRLRQRDRNRRG